MASVTTTVAINDVARHPKKRLLCFSFAAYARSLIDHLQSLNIPVLPGLTDHEFSALESSFNLSFPPDLRSILQEGLPAGPHFPNWRFSSEQQLRILIDLPRLNLLRNISTNSFWVDFWGAKPERTEEAVKKAKIFIDKAPLLVPVYRNCYIPCTGNPVFYVDDREVRVISYDATRFFQEIEFLELGVFRPVALAERFETDAPPWGATAARRVEFWTEVAERGRRVVRRGPSQGWWGGGGDLGACMEEMFWRLRDGGWGEEEVREMMMVMDGSDDDERRVVAKESDSVDWHVRILAIVLLRGGWSTEDVAYSLDLSDDQYTNPNTCSPGNSDHRQITSSINPIS